MDLDPVFLSRVQFAFVIAFHILLPAFTVGLASFIVLLEGLHVVKRDAIYLRLSVFWTRI
ncbi:MAG: cytochrome ubiquinol oxidase subunit I, partial [Betaproteobacteria bacterium]